MIAKLPAGVGSFAAPLAKIHVRADWLDEVKALTDGKRVDIVIETTGGDTGDA